MKEEQAILKIWFKHNAQEWSVVMGGFQQRLLRGSTFFFLEVKIWPGGRI